MSLPSDTGSPSTNLGESASLTFDAKVRMRVNPSIVVSLALVMEHAFGAASPRANGPGIDHITSATLAAALDSTMRSGSKGVMFRLSDDRHAQYLMNRRTAPSAIELHCEWDDLLFVRAGAGTLSHSRRVQGPTMYGYGE